MVLTVPGGGAWSVPLSEVFDLSYAEHDLVVHLHLEVWRSPTGTPRLSMDMGFWGDRRWLDALLTRIEAISQRLGEPEEPMPPEYAEPVAETPPPAPPIRGPAYAELHADWLGLRPLPDTLALGAGDLIQPERAPGT